MKVIYECSKCGAQYKSSEEAMTCESSHLEPDAVECSYGYNRDVPYRITATFGKSKVIYQAEGSYEDGKDEDIEDLRL